MEHVQSLSVLLIQLPYLESIIGVKTIKMLLRTTNREPSSDKLSLAIKDPHYIDRTLLYGDGVEVFILPLLLIISVLLEQCVLLVPLKAHVLLASSVGQGIRSPVNMKDGEEKFA